MSYGVGLRNGVAFALGTIPSLTSGGGLRPSLLLNFLSGSLDPRITFSRGTQAMQYGSDGTLQYAPNNLLTYSNQADNAAWTKSNSFVQTNLVLWSQDFDNAAWTKSLATVSANAITAPDGTLTADLITPTGQFGGVLSTITGLTIGAQYTYSFWAKSNTNTNVLTFRNDTAGTNIGTYTPTSDWVRYSFTFTAAGTSAALWPIQDRNASGFGSTYVWGAQLVQGSVPGDYVATTSAALPVLYADYNGALRARKLCEDSSNSTHNFNENAGTVGNTETLSFYAKSGERSWAISQLGGSHLAYFDLTNGVLGNVSGGATATIVASGSGWYRCTLTAPRALNTSNFIYCTTGNAVSTYSGNGSSGIYIADAQLTPGYLPLAVTETTSAAVYGPRFDYDPSSLVTQNLLLYSEQFDNAVWTTSEATISSNVAIAPDGTLTADKFTPSTTPAVVHTVRQSFTTTGGAFSVYAKAAGETTFSLWFVAAGQGVLFDLAAGTTSGISGSISSTITNVGNGWYRCTGAFTGATTLVHIYGRNGSGFAGDGVSGVYIWGAQLNRGSTALPYTATTTAPYTLTTARGLLIEEQRTNLATFSNTFSDASWTALGTKNVAASAILSPEGVANAWTLTDSSAVAFDGIQKGVTVAADGTTYTGSIYILKTAGGTSSTFGINLAITGGTTVTNQPRINTDTGAVLSGTATVTNAGLWWRVACSVTNNSSVGNTTLTISLYPATAAYNSATDTAAATGSATIYGAQIETGAFATSYIPTVASTATRNADSATIPASTWYNTAAGTWYFNGETQTFPRYLIVDNSGAAKYPMYVHSAAGGIGNFDGTNLTLTGNNTTARTTFKAATTYSGSVATAVLNGGTVATGTYNGAFSTIATFKLGGATGAGGEIDGHIQSIRFYPTALSSVSQQSITV